LKIYDVLGNEAATLVGEYKPAENYKVEFNTLNLTSGVYIVMDDLSDTNIIHLKFGVTSQLI